MSGAEGLRAFATRHERTLLVAVLALAFLVRVAMLLSLQGSVYENFLFWDERTYDRWARSIVEGTPYYVYSVSPLPAYWTAALYRLLGPDALLVRCVHLVLGVATCGLLFEIGRRLAGPVVGLASALVGALYQPFVLMSVTLLKEPLGLLLFAWAVAIALVDAATPRPLRSLLLGVVGGLLVNVRQNAIVVLLVLGPWLAWRLARRTASWRAPVLALSLLAAGFASATAPFAIANGRGTGRYLPVALGGFDLYRGNVLDGPTPYYNPVGFSSTNPDTQGVEFAVEASRRVGRTLTLAEASDYWTGEVWRAMREHPSAFGRRLLQKALASINAWEEGDDHSIPFLRDHLPFLRVPLFACWLVMPLGLAGLLALAIEGDGRARAMLAVVLAYGATMVLVFSNMRIRAPLVIVLIPYGVAGLERAFRLRTALGWAAAVAAIAVLECLPVPGSRDLTAHENAHAAALTAAGRPDEAVTWWKRASGAHGLYSCFADLSLATAAYARGDSRTAWAWLNRIPANSHAAALRYATAGYFLSSEGDAKGAAAAFDASLFHNSAQFATVAAAIESNRSVNPDRARELQRHLAYLRKQYGPLAQDAPVATEDAAER